MQVASTGKTVRLNGPGFWERLFGAKEEDGYVEPAKLPSAHLVPQAKVKRSVRSLEVGEKTFIPQDAVIIDPEGSIWVNLNTLRDDDRDNPLSSLTLMKMKKGYKVYFAHSGYKWDIDRNFDRGQIGEKYGPVVQFKYFSDY